MKEWKGEVKFEYPKIKENSLSQIPVPCIIEPKYDGELTFLYFDTEKRKWVTVNSYGHYRSDFPVTKEAEVLDKNYVYVGELVAGENLYDFLREKSNPEKLRLVVFDVMPLSPSMRMRDYLKAIESIPLPTWDSGISILSKTILNVLNRKEDLEGYYWFFVHFLGFEGVVCRSLKTEEIWKVKKKRTVDVIILGISKEGKSYERKEVGSFLVGLYHNGQLKKVGKVGSGLKLNDRKALWNLLTPFKIGEDNNYIYIEPKLVVEVEVNDFIKSNEYDFPLTFRNPRIARFRVEKNPIECEVYHQAPELVGEDS